jgi:predicted Holliday junction resolvase-like endonuclease
MEYLVASYALLIVAMTLLGLKQLKEYKKLSQHFNNLKANNEVLKQRYDELIFNSGNVELQNKVLEQQLGDEKEKNRKILSQKKSSETRLGQITEQIAPLLDSFPYDPKSLHFLGDPIDFVAFDLTDADPAVVFIEVKSGNSKLSSRQRTIRNLINKGSVRFEEMRVGPDGIKSNLKGAKTTTKKKVTRKRSVKK